MNSETDKAYDAWLAAAARAGGKAAMASLAARWQGRLYRHAARLVRDPDLAADVAQDAWSDIVRSIANLGEPRAFPAWAYRIVTRRAADAIRRRASTRRLEAAFAVEPQMTEAGPAGELAADMPPVRRAMAALPPEQAAALALFYGDGLTVAEVAAALDAPGGTIKTRLMHARRKLREALGLNEEGDAS